MGKSRRRTPIMGNSGSSSDKWFKTDGNRRHRHVVKQQLRQDPDREVFRELRSCSNTWCSSKDGRHWFGYMKHDHRTWYDYHPNWPYEPDPDEPTYHEQYLMYMRK